MGDPAVSAIRAFNRFYTRQIGLLSEHVATSAFTLGEGRVLYEIGQLSEVSATELAASLRLDTAYLSRILHKFSTAGLLAFTPHPTDRRTSRIALSAEGRAAVDELDRRNEAAIEMVLEGISPEDRTDLVAAMDRIGSILGRDTPRGPVILRPHRLGEIGWMIHRQALLYNRQFGWNVAFEALIAGIYSAYEKAPQSPPRNLWVAEQAGGIVGSIFVQPTDDLPGAAQLRMLYVEPLARGQRVGTTLVAQAVSFAREAGYERMRLWTHANQESARRIYAAAGFAIVETMPEENFGKQLLGEIWEKRF